MRFFKDMLSEGGKISHKRWISVTVAATICYGIVYVIHKYEKLISTTLNSAMIFVAVMSGVATVAQVAAILRRGGESTTNEKSTTTTESSSQTTKSE